jgi:hypothetical protein
VGPGARSRRDRTEPAAARVPHHGLREVQVRGEEEGAGEPRKQHQVQIKELRVRPGTGDHDLQVKIKQARQFFADGDKVLVCCLFRGRQIAHKEVGEQVIQEVVKELADIAKVERASASRARGWSSCSARSTAPTRRREPARGATLPHRVPGSARPLRAVPPYAPVPNRSAEPQPAGGPVMHSVLISKKCSASTRPTRRRSTANTCRLPTRCRRVARVVRHGAAARAARQRRRHEAEAAPAASSPAEPVPTTNCSR